MAALFGVRVPFPTTSTTTGTTINIIAFAVRVGSKQGRHSHHSHRRHLGKPSSNGTSLVVVTLIRRSFSITRNSGGINIYPEYNTIRGGPQRQRQRPRRRPRPSPSSHPVTRTKTEPTEPTKTAIYNNNKNNNNNNNNDNNKSIITMSKRSAPNIMNLLSKKSREDERTAKESGQSNSASSSSAAGMGGGGSNNPYLRHPTDPHQALFQFLSKARSTARNLVKAQLPVKVPFCEIEARVGILKSAFGEHDRRVCSSGPKSRGGRVVPSFNCTDAQPRAMYESGITRSHHVHWTQAGLSELSPISHALGVMDSDASVKRDLLEVEYVETVYSGYPHERRVTFEGVHEIPRGGGGGGPPPTNNSTTTNNNNGKCGQMEYKERLSHMDLAVPAAPYDIRIQLATEKVVNHNVPSDVPPPPGWSSKRIKRRRCYTRKDKSIKWQIDVTEVTTSYPENTNRASEVAYELEMELHADVTLQLVNETDENKGRKLLQSLSQQLWWMLSQLNPLTDVLDVEEFLQDHPNKAQGQLALAQCGALRKFMENPASNAYQSPIATKEANPKLANVNFCGCMPVNFSRHNIEEVQRSPENGYFLSEKTDGVRHFLVFTGETAVLVDRAMRPKQPKPRGGNADGDGKASSSEPFAFLLDLIQPGTVLDGEVVLHRKLRRPIFIVFDVLTINVNQPVLHLPFEKRLQYLKQASFRTPTAQRDMFDPKAVPNMKIALPLVRKNFVKRQDLDSLLEKVVEERGMRTYRHGETHCHLTDGIIYQPNLPYVCGTDQNLLKWKYLDTVTIDVEIQPNLPHLHQHRSGHGNNNDEDVLRLAVGGEENTRVDMTRHIHLPPSERRRLEADRAESGSTIAEVGFDPTTGEWYYLTMRPDKIAPNHISTVLGTLLELAEYLTTEELRYRMSVPLGQRDTYRKDVRGMQKQLLEHQRRKTRDARGGGGGSGAGGGGGRPK